MDERVFLCQKQHADVVAVLSSGGSLIESARYSAYGVPFGMPAGDTDSDGDCGRRVRIADKHAVPLLEGPTIRLRAGRGCTWTPRK